MIILSISTSSNICSVALLDNITCICELNIDDAKTHSEKLMPLIDEILSKNNLSLSNIDLIACDIGPGSFTGIRIGIATIKALAEFNNIPVVGVSSLEGLAYNSNINTDICTLIDARNNQVYCGIFDKDKNLLKDFLADDINNIFPKLRQLDNITFVGDGAFLHKELILANFLNSNFVNDNNIHATQIGICAHKKFNNNIVQNADTITPLYLRKSQAERMKSLNG